MDDSEELLSEPSEFEDDENGSRSTPPNLRNDADNVRRDILPDKSEERYRKQLNHFNSWRNDNDIASRLSDNIVLAYYSELRKTLKASSLFSKMAMLKKTLFVEYQFPQNSACWTTCTSTSKKDKAKQPTNKAAVLEPEHIQNFVENCRDTSSVELLALLIAYHAALRPTELSNMQFDDVTLKPNGDFVINVHDRKTSTYSSTSTWTVSGSLPRNHWSNPTPHYLAMRSLREAFEKKGGIIKDKRLLMQIRDGKFHNQAIGEESCGI